MAAMRRCTDCGVTEAEHHLDTCVRVRGRTPYTPGERQCVPLDDWSSIPPGVIPTPDIIVKPDHYARWAIEPITFIMRNGFEFWRGNIVKYASRAGFKRYDGQDAVESEITDLKKVIRYAEMRINQLQGDTVL